MNTPWTPWAGYYQPPPQTGPTLQDLIMGQQWLDSLKENFEKEQKNKKKKEEKKKITLPKFSFMELWGAVMLFSIPVTIGQLVLAQMVLTRIHDIATIIHP